MTTHENDTTRRTLAQARRIPQWQRLIDSIHKAQELKGYDGRQFGEGEMQFFEETLIGLPVEKLTRPSFHTREFEAAYWVARSVFEHSDGTESVTYRLKSVHGDDLANVDTITDATAHTTGYDGTGTVLTPEWEEATALDFIRRAQFQVGRS